MPAPGASGVDESASTKSPAKMKGRDIWQQLDITGTDLVEYNEKIRLWLSSTVLQVRRLSSHTDDTWNILSALC